MKVRIELDPEMDEAEMIIRAPRLTEDLAQLQQMILDRKMTTLTFYKDRSEYFVNVSVRQMVKRSMGIQGRMLTRCDKSSMN